MSLEDQVYTEVSGYRGYAGSRLLPHSPHRCDTIRPSWEPGTQNHRHHLHHRHRRCCLISNDDDDEGDDDEGPAPRGTSPASGSSSR